MDLERKQASKYLKTTVNFSLLAPFLADGRRYGFGAIAVTDARTGAPLPCVQASTEVHSTQV